MAASATAQATLTDPLVELARRQRLVGPPDRAVALRVDEVVGPADRELAGEHGGHDQHEVRRAEPDRDPEQPGQQRDREGGPGVGGAEQRDDRALTRRPRDSGPSSSCLTEALSRVAEQVSRCSCRGPWCCAPHGVRCAPRRRTPP